MLDRDFNGNDEKQLFVVVVVSAVSSGRNNGEITVQFIQINKADLLRVVAFHLFQLNIIRYFKYGFF